MVELLVAIVVLGIITAMAVPLIRKLKYDQDEQKYKTYRKSMEYSAKLYIDAYGEDEFSNKEVGCIVVPYSTLAEKKLIKDISIEDTSCANDGSKVYIKKNGNNYEYYVVAKCNGKEKGKDEVPADVLNNCVTESAVFEYLFEPDGYTKLDRKQIKINVLLKSTRGINQYTDIVYYFKDKNGQKTPEKKLNLSIPSEDQQKQDLANKKEIKVSTDIITPEGITGYYTLFIENKRLLSLEGDAYNETKKSKQYTIDNQIPGTKGVLNSSENYNVLDPSFLLNGNDNMTKKKDLRICVSLDKDTCGKDLTSIKDKNKYPTVNDYFKNENSKIIHINDNYDSSLHRFFVNVVDLAGNIKSEVLDYKVAQQYNITYNINPVFANQKIAYQKYNNSDIKSDYIRFNEDTNPKWGELNSRSGGKLMKPTSTTHDFNGWNTKANGSGTKVDDNTLVKSTEKEMKNKTLTLYAQWIPKKYDVTFNGNGATGGSTPATICYYNKNCTLPANGFEKTGHTFKGWSEQAAGPIQYTNNQTVVFKKEEDKIPLYAQWERKKYTVTYDYKTNGGQSVTKDTDSILYEYDVPVDIKSSSTPKAAKSGWTFVGWNTKSDATTGLTSYKMPAENKTLYAIFRKEAIKQSVSWNSNGATLSSTANSECTIPAVYNNQEQKTSCTVTAPTITRNGYRPIGFSQINSDHNEEVKSGGTLTINSSNNKKTYYAITAKELTATFNGNSNNVSNEKESCYIFNAETSCNVTTPTPKWSNHYFFTWSTNNQATKAELGANKQLTLKGNIIYYAIWYMRAYLEDEEADYTTQGTISNVREIKDINETYGSLSGSLNEKKYKYTITAEEYEREDEATCRDTDPLDVRTGDKTYSKKCDPCPSGYQTINGYCYYYKDYNYPSHSWATKDYICDYPPGYSGLHWWFNGTHYETNNSCEHGVTIHHACDRPTLGNVEGSCDTQSKTITMESSCTYICKDEYRQNCYDDWDGGYKCSYGETQEGSKCYSCSKGYYDGSVCVYDCSEWNWYYRYDVYIEYFV